MFPFLLKKAFFDLWDNLFVCLLVNFVFTVVVLATTLLGGIAPTAVVVAVGIVVVQLLTGWAWYLANDIASHGRVDWKQLLPHFQASWKTSLVIALVWMALVAGFFVGVPFYTAMNEWAGLGFGVLLFWLAFFVTGLTLYVPGLQTQVGGKISALVRKGFLLFMAHPLLSFLLFASGLVFTALSVVTLGFFPGILGLQLWFQTGFKFLLARYDWLEKNPDHDPKAKFPWKQALEEDMDKVGPRSLRGMIFPWKD